MKDEQLESLCSCDDTESRFYQDHGSCEFCYYVGEEPEDFYDPANHPSCPVCGDLEDYVGCSCTTKESL